MILKGLIADCIERVTETPLSELDFATEASWALENGGEQYNLTGETLRPAFDRTIVADMECEGYHPVKRGFAMDWSYQRQDEDLTGALKRIKCVKSATMGQRLAFTRRNFMGFVPAVAQEGDIIWGFMGVFGLERSHYTSI